MEEAYYEVWVNGPGYTLKLFPTPLTAEQVEQLRTMLKAEEKIITTKVDKDADLSSGY